MNWVPYSKTCRSKILESTRCSPFNIFPTDYSCGFLSMQRSDLKDSRMRGTLLWLAVACYAALIFLFSSFSRPVPFRIPDIFMIDKVIHFFEYLIFGILLFSAMKEGRSPKKAAIWSFIIASVYGLTDEFHQYYVQMRHADFFDFLADSAGGGAGAFLALIFSRGGVSE